MSNPQKVGVPPIPNSALDLEQFKLAWAEVIAHAWMDPEFEKQLYEMSPDQIRSMFDTSYDVHVPDDLDIKIIKLNDQTNYWDPKRQVWHLVTKVPVEIGLPPRPEQGDQWGIAIAEYSRLTSRFPLSCSC